MSLPDRLSIKRLDPIQTPAFEYVRDSKGEIIGYKTYQELTAVEFKKQFLGVVLIDDQRNKDS